MDNRKLIAEALLEIAERSETTFLDIGKKDKDLIDAAKKIGIELPSPDLMVMKTVYAEIDKVNKNGVILPKKAVKKGLKTLIGKQCNWEHNGSGFVCGYTIKADINEDKIETINVIFKSLFPEQVEELKEKVKSGEAAVSFEIWNIDPVTKQSVVKELENGFKEINPIICHGTGVLLVHQPACPKAKIFKLIAKKELDGNQIKNRVFTEDLIFAQLAIEEPKCKNCKKCNCEKEEKKVELEKLFSDVKKEEDITFEMAMAFYYASDEEKAKLTEDAAKWTRKFINSLPDSAFAAIEPAYPEKIEDKNARHLPHHNGTGDLGKDKSNANLDLPHYKNALARVNQIKPVTDSISAEDLQKKASSHLERHKDALEKSSEETKTEVETTETKTDVTPETEVKVEPENKEKTDVAETKVEKPEVDETKKEETEAKPEETSEVNTSKEEPKKEAEEKKEEVAEEKKEEVETKETKDEGKDSPEEKKDENSEVIEPKIIVKKTSILSEIRTDTYIDGTPSGTTDVKFHKKIITEYKNGEKDEVEEKVDIKKKYDFAEVEEKINEAIENLIAALPKEVTDCVKQKTKDGMKPADAVKECWKEYKEKQSKAIAEEINKKETEITKLKEELGKKDQEIAKLNTPKDEEQKDKVEENKDPMEVGEVDSEQKSEIDTAKENINKIIASKHENK